MRRLVERLFGVAVKLWIIGGNTLVAMDKIDRQTLAVFFGLGAGLVIMWKEIEDWFDKGDPPQGGSKPPGNADNQDIEIRRQMGIL